MRLIKSPLGNPDIHLDGFAVMNNGIHAVRYLQREGGRRSFRGNESVEHQLGTRLSLYHFYPLLKSSGRERELPGLFYDVPNLGGISEPQFVKSGPAIVIDDAVSTGRTLGYVVRYLEHWGYSHDEMFVFAQRFFPPEDGERGLGTMMPYTLYHVSTFAELLDEVLPEGIEKARLVC